MLGYAVGASWPLEHEVEYFNRNRVLENALLPMSCKSDLGNVAHYLYNAAQIGQVTK